ncbi:site-specific integrase [Neoroseomonas oryzicola]|uniref:Site-specific integrase n=1 Tax=Neoroseomonas oryzicola TaxID=535904 RepID=A0A9X9WPH8_9PROT|nr:site-specific integrase [Neoroseomonas oryzicola]MBR0662238.1 site-specific integrase [Neoroseomonas oryzicola]NKE19760.1 site-specific integrase [Neoroseomonas oryzicola]
MTGTAIRPHAALPVAAWPAADQAAWQAAHRQGDFLVKAGHATTWRAASQRSAAGAYGRWLGWLQSRDVALSNEAPSDRFTEERTRAYVAFLQHGRSPVTVASYLGLLCMTVVALFPDRDWAWLRGTQARLARRAKPVRDKRSRLVPVGGLEQLGLDLLERSGSELDKPRTGEADRRRVLAAARDYRDGLMIALLASRAPRLKNLLGIEIGVQLRDTAGLATLHFAASEMKDKKARTMSWPRNLLAGLERYLTVVRPMLIAATAPIDPKRPARPAGAMLWVAQGGTPLTAGGLQKALRRHTAPRFGHAINAHLFRDCAATTYANERPAHIRGASALLGHSRASTTARNYIAVDTRPAVAQHQEVMLALQRAARRRRRTEKE